MSPLAFVSGVMSGLLAWVGLTPVASSAPVAPAESVGLWAVLAWVRREIERTFFNQAPSLGFINYSQNADGVITGDLDAVDPEGDPLVFTVTQNPEHGTVVINADGTFTYTPEPDFAATGGADSFTVKVSDTGFHLHGLLGFLQPDWGHSHEETSIGLAVTPTNDTPVVVDPGYTVDHVDTTTGVVTGSVYFSDPDGDVLTHTVIGGADKGTVTVDPVTGDWTYTPSIEARLAATDINATREDRQAVFIVWAEDDFAGTGVQVIAPITPLAITPIHVGDGPAWVAVSPDGGRVYVLNGLDRTVSVMDTATNQVVGEPIPVCACTGLSAASTVAVSPDGSYAYVARASEDNVVVIDLTTNEVVGDPIPVAAPLVVAFTPDGSYAYITNSFEDGTVSVIDTATHMVVGTAISVGAFPGVVAISPDGAYAYVVNIEDDTVSVISTAANHAVGDPIAVGDNPVGVAFTADGAYAYVTNMFDDTVSVIDTATKQVVGDPIPAGSRPSGVATSPDGAYVYVTNFGDGTVSVLDTATNAVIATIPVGDEPGWLAVSPDGAYIYLTNFGDDTVSVITILPAPSVTV